MIVVIKNIIFKIHKQKKVLLYIHNLGTTITKYGTLVPKMHNQVIELAKISFLFILYLFTFIGPIMIIPEQ